MSLRTSLIAVAALATLLPSGVASADPCNFGPQDFSGDWTLDGSEILCSGTYHVSGTVTIPAGTQVQLGTTSGAGTQVVIIAQRALVHGTVVGDGVGRGGGAGCHGVRLGGGNDGYIPGNGGGGGAPAYTTNNTFRGGSGGGGGGYGGAGGTGGQGNNPDTTPGTGGIEIGTAGIGANPSISDVVIGSGGGGGSCSTDSNGDYGGNGGRGGAGLAIVAKDIDVQPDTGSPPSISMGGGAGQDTPDGTSAGGGGGGGSGGTIALVGTEQVTINYNGANPALAADGAGGGHGGETTPGAGIVRKGGGGGGGAGGRIKIARPLGCPNFPNAFVGGAGGSAHSSGKPGSAGSAGTYDCAILDAPPVVSSLSLSRTQLDVSDPTGVTLTAGSTTNPYLRRIEYEFDCQGNGSYGAPQTSNSYTCHYAKTGAYQPVVRASDWNSIQITIPQHPSPPGGATPGTYDPGTFAFGDTSTATAATVSVNPLPQVTIKQSGNKEEGAIQTFTATITDPANDTFSTHWDFGDGSTAETPPSAAKSVAQTHAFADDGTYTVTVTVTDNDGGTDTATLQVPIANVPPTVTLGSLASSYATTPETLSASATDPSSADSAAGFAYDFTVTDPSGAATVLHVAATANNGSGVSATYTPATAGTYTVSVTATDKDNGISAPATGSFTALAPAPIVELTPTPADATVPESGTALQVDASWTDPLPADRSAPFSYVWDFGDGSALVSGKTADPDFTSTSVTHQYANSGSYPLKLEVTNAAGAMGTASLQVTVTKVPPTLTLSPPSAIVEAMTAISFQASATGPSPSDTQAPYQYTFTWGDQTNDIVSGGPQVNESHRYQDVGTYTVTVTATDQEGVTSAQAKATVQVTDVAPTVTLTGAQTGNEGDTLAFAATGHDVSPADQARGFTYTWDFGDGTPAASGPATDSHAFEKAGDYKVTVTARDTARLSGSATLPVSIANVAPTVDLGGDRDALKNVPLVFAPTVTDPGTLDTFTYAWGFGDGTTSTSATPSHAYTAYGTYVVRLTVTDSNGATGSDSISVHVNDRAPTATGVAISPAQPYSTDALTLSYSYSDPDGDPEKGTQIVWTADGVEQPAFTGKTTIPAGVTHPNQVWTAQVTPSDGLLFGSTVASDPVTILDHAPTVTSVAIAPSEPRHADDLTLSYAYHDQDGDPERGTTILWSKTPAGATDAQPEPAFDNRSTVPGPLTKGDVWVATVTPSDGYLAGTPVSSTVTVQNTPPQILGPKLVAVPATGSTATVTFTLDATDVDGDPLTYSCSGDGTPSANGPTVTGTFAVGTWQVTCSVSDGTDTTTTTITIAVGDVPPVVDAGPDQVVDPGEPFVHATAKDALGRPLTYQWEFESAASNPVPVLLTPNAPDTGFYARTAGDYQLKVTVSNGVEQASAQTTVTVRNLPPWASIAPVGTAHPGDFILLDGSASSDPNGDSLTYAWEQVSGPAATFEDGSGQPLSPPTGAIVHLVAPAAGEIVVRLTASDGSLSGQALATIDVVGSTNPMAPIANAGPDQTVLTGETVQLDGSASVSLDGGALSFLWTVTQGAEPRPAIQSADQAKAQFVAASAGQWTLELTVTDGTLSSTDDLVVTVVDSQGDHRPVAHISPATVNTRLAETVTLDGSNSTDQDPGTTLTYRWTQVAGPHVALAGQDQPRVSFVTTAPGTLVIALVVDDGQVDSLPATATIHVTSGADVQPIAKATGPAAGVVGRPVTLDGTKSYSPSGAELTYAWRQAGGPQVSLDDQTSPAPTYVPEKPGTYVFELTVDDGELPSAPASVATAVSQHPLPIARIDAPDGGYVGVSVAADGSKSVATDGAKLSYTWTLEGRPEVTLSGAHAASSSFVPPENGSYVLKLVVNDGTFDSSPVTKTITVHDLPVARGGCSQTGALSFFALLGLLALLRRRRACA